jgi:hypothetical protein
MSCRIRLVAKTNPKHKGSAARERYHQYSDGMTIEDYFRACDRLNVRNHALFDITWDVGHGFIELID